MEMETAFMEMEAAVLVAMECTGTFVFSVRLHVEEEHERS
jgi:hypothetical protein